jgi:hypothetical protein
MSTSLVMGAEIVDALQAHGIRAVSDPQLERVLCACPFCIAPGWLPVEIGLHGGLRAVCKASISHQHDVRVAERLGELLHGGGHG